jgi:hypothetical protein
MLDWALRSALFEVADVLCFSFDLELQQLSSPPDWFRVADADCQTFAADATGGAYAIATFEPTKRRYGIHVDPCGKSAVLGGSVQETIAIVIALPYWRDLLKLAKSRELDPMRRLADTLEAEVQDDIPAIDDARRELWRVLPLEAPADPVRRLYDLNLASPPAVVVLGADGWQYRSLAAARTVGSSVA